MAFALALTFCVRAEAAAVLASLLALGLRRIFDAALAAFLPVVSALCACVRADAAAFLADLVAAGSARTRAAADAAAFPVLSPVGFFAMLALLSCWLTTEQELGSHLVRFAGDLQHSHACRTGPTRWQIYLTARIIATTNSNEDGDARWRIRLRRAAMIM